MWVDPITKLVDRYINHCLSQYIHIFTYLRTYLLTYLHFEYILSGIDLLSSSSNCNYSESCGARPPHGDSMKWSYIGDGLSSKV